MPLDRMTTGDWRLLRGNRRVRCGPPQARHCLFIVAAIALQGCSSGSPPADPKLRAAFEQCERVSQIVAAAFLVHLRSIDRAKVRDGCMAPHLPNEK